MTVVIRLVQGMIFAQQDGLKKRTRSFPSAATYFGSTGIQRVLCKRNGGGELSLRGRPIRWRSRTYRIFLRMPTAAGDIESQARLHNNLGYCAIRLNDYSSANIQFSQAVARFTDLGFNAEVARTERGRPSLIARAQISSGIERLHNARHAFMATGNGRGSRLMRAQYR